VWTLMHPSSPMLNSAQPPTRTRRSALVAVAAVLGLSTVLVFAVSSCAADASRCQVSDIHLSRGGENGAGGTEGVPFVLRYSGSGSCSLAGYASLKFFDRARAPIMLRVYVSNLSYYAKIRPSKLSLSRSHPVSFGIEFTQNLNQADHAASCIAPRAHVTLPLAARGQKRVFSMSWPTGMVAWNYAIDWCFADWTYGETSVEGRSSPTMA
jgi:hypothetical protein